MAATSLAADRASFQVGKRCQSMQSAGFLGMCQRIGFSSATLLAFIVLGGSITDASAQDRVRLTFAWPETVRATVTTSFDTASVAGGNRSRLTGTSRARVSASPTEDGLLISYETGATQFESRSDDGIWVRIHEFLFEVGLQHPDFQVGRDGRFRNVGDPITHINAVATDLAGEIARHAGQNEELCAAGPGASAQRTGTDRPCRNQLGTGGRQLVGIAAGNRRPASDHGDPSISRPSAGRPQVSPER